MNLIQNLKLRRLLFLIAGTLLCIVAYNDQVWWIGFAGLYFIILSFVKLDWLLANWSFGKKEK